MANKDVFLCLTLFISVFVSCRQSGQPEPVSTGDLYFSGYYWNFKNTNDIAVGPGPNRFTSKYNNIFLDAGSSLHLKIVKNNSQWYCSELVSVKTFGYGTYIFTTASDLTTMNERVVLGLFTWNNYSFQTQANSEIDIEFARWNVASDTLLASYSVQPVWGDNPIPYLERTRKPRMLASRLKSTCTHVFRWTPGMVSWVSYSGGSYPGTDTLAYWSFDSSNPSRSKMEGGKIANPIVIPTPEDSTNVRFNLWLMNGLPPSDNKEFEVVIKSFRFIPL